MNKSSVESSEIVSIINMMELDNLKDLILEAKEKIEGYSKTGTFKERFLGILKLDFIGNKISNHIDSTENVGTVLKSLFDSFIIKQDRILELMNMLEDLQKKIESHTFEMKKFLTEIDNQFNEEVNQSDKIRLKRLSTLVTTTILKNEDKIKNKIKPALLLAGKTLDNMTVMLPSLQADLINEVGIAGALNSIKDMNEMLKETISLTNEITIESQKKTQELIFDTIKITNSKDAVKYLIDNEKNIEAFNKTLNKELEKLEKDIVDEYHTVKKLYDERDKIIENKKEEHVLLSN